MSRGLAKSGGQRTCRNNWSNAGKHQRDRGKHLSAELTEPSRGPRIFDIGSRRGIHLLRQRPFLVVRPGNDGDLFARDARRVQRTRGSSRGRRIGEEREHEGMRHWLYLTSRMRHD
jgi:hypothetical protein